MRNLCTVKRADTNVGLSLREQGELLLDFLLRCRDMKKVLAWNIDWRGIFVFFLQDRTQRRL